MRALPLLLCCLVAACTPSDPRAEASDPERVLLDRLTMDRRVRIVRTYRDGSGHLVVWTRQGDERVGYTLRPTGENGALRIEPVGRGLPLPATIRPASQRPFGR